MADSARSTKSGPPLLGFRVLLVEDEAMIAMDLQATLERAGAEIVGPAATLAEALSLAAEPALAAALLDVRLGRDSAMPVAQVLAERGVPFAFYSGQSGEEVQRHFPGATTLQKPISPGELVEAMAALAAPPSGGLATAE